MTKQSRPWLDCYDDGARNASLPEPKPLPMTLAWASQNYADSPAIVYFNRTMTYAELHKDVDSFASALEALGVEKGTRVGIQLPNIPQAVIACYATLALGGHVVMTNPLYVEREIIHQWNDAGCSTVVVTDDLFARRIHAIRGDVGVKNFIVTSIPDYMRPPMRWVAAAKLKRARPAVTVSDIPGKATWDMADLMKKYSGAPAQAELSVDDVAVLQYTGGTTGVSKGAMLTHRNLSSNVSQVAAWFTSAEVGGDVFLSALPFFHVFGLTVGLNLPVSSAAAMVLMPDPRDIRRMISAIEKNRVTVFPGVPSHFNSINHSKRIDDVDLTSVKVCISGSAPLPRDVGERFAAMTNSSIMEGFGLTEASPVTHANPLEGVKKEGSIGVPLPETDAKIVSLDDGVTRMETGEQGELLIRGPQVMKGYCNQPQETAEVIVDGWLHTGDIATMDEEGYFYIVGRKKDVIIAGGYNIFPDEIDDVLMSHEAVLEAGTIGVPDPKRGETVKSFVVLTEGLTIEEKELIEFCRTQLAPYKAPRQIEFRDSLPKSGALKILRRELRDEELRKRES